MKFRSVSIAYSITKSRNEKEKTLKLEHDKPFLNITFTPALLLSS
jgi:hypothetical protein